MRIRLVASRCRNHPEKASSSPCPFYIQKSNVFWPNVTLLVFDLFHFISVKFMDTLWSGISDKVIVGSKRLLLWCFEIVPLNADAFGFFFFRLETPRFCALKPMSRLSFLGDTAVELIFQIAAGLIIGLLGWEVLKLGARTFREPGKARQKISREVG